MPRLTAVRLGCLLLAGYGILLLLNVSIPQPVDHSRYMDAARDFPSAPENAAHNHQYLRIGLTAPTAVLMKVFGYSEVSYHAFPVLCALLLFASVYAIGCLLFGRVVGAVSAVVLGCTGVVLVAATELLPDLPATALFTAAVALAVALQREHRWVAGRQPATLVLIGLLLGWSYLVREFVVFVWPLVLVLLWRRVRGWQWLQAAVPIVAIVAVEMTLNAWLYDTPLARLTESAEQGSGPARPEVAATVRDKPLWVYLWRLPEQLAAQPEAVLLLSLLAATVAGGIIARRRLGFFLLWTGMLWVPLTLLGGVLNPDAPKLRLQLIRYWYPLLPAIALGGVAACWLAAIWLRERTSGSTGARRAISSALPLGAALLLAAGYFSLSAAGRAGAGGWAENPRLRATGQGALPEMRSWLASHQDVRRLWVDPRLFRIMPIYVRSPHGRVVWRGDVEGLFSPSQPQPGDHIVAYSAGSMACHRCGDSAQAVLGSSLTVPPSWEPVMTSTDRLLRIWRVT